MVFQFREMDKKSREINRTRTAGRRRHVSVAFAKTIPVLDETWSELERGTNT
jgi:hypothetical protein